LQFGLFFRKQETSIIHSNIFGDSEVSDNFIISFYFILYISTPENIQKYVSPRMCLHKLWAVINHGLSWQQGCELSRSSVLFLFPKVSAVKDQATCFTRNSVKIFRNKNLPTSWTVLKIATLWALI
jgi:hypothetical protein